MSVKLSRPKVLCLVHLLTENLFWVYSIFLGILIFWSILKMILVYPKVGLYYINWLIWVYVPKSCWVYFKKWVCLKNLSTLKTNFESADGLGIWRQFRSQITQCNVRSYLWEMFSFKILTWEYWHIVTGIWFDWTGLIPIQGTQWTFRLFKRGKNSTESCWRRLVELWIQKIEQLRLPINVKWGNDLLKVNW